MRSDSHVSTNSVCLSKPSSPRPQAGLCGGAILSTCRPILLTQPPKCSWLPPSFLSVSAPYHCSAPFQHSDLCSMCQQGIFWKWKSRPITPLLNNPTVAFQSCRDKAQPSFVRLHSPPGIISQAPPTLHTATSFRCLRVTSAQLITEACNPPTPITSLLVHLLINRQP